MKLKDIIRLDSRELYRLHIAKKSNGSAPLNDYLDSFGHWENWQKSFSCQIRDFLHGFLPEAVKLIVRRNI